MYSLAVDLGPGGTRPHVFCVVKMQHATCSGATLCHIDKCFLDLGPRISNRETRLTLMQLDDIGSFIKFYGTRTERFLQDETILRVTYMKANLMRTEGYKITFTYFQFNCEKFTILVVA